MTARREDERPLAEGEHLMYRKLVGTLRYVADTVGYEIAYTDSALSAHQNSPCLRYQLSLHRLLCYISGRRDRSITCTQDENHLSVFEDFVDSDWEGCTDSRRIRSGVAIQYSSDSDEWLSKMKATVLLFRKRLILRRLIHSRFDGQQASPLARATGLPDQDESARVAHQPRSHPYALLHFKQTPGLLERKKGVGEAESRLTEGSSSPQRFTWTTAEPSP